MKRSSTFTLQKAWLALACLATPALAEAQTAFTTGTNPFNMTMVFPTRLLTGDFDNDGDVDILYQAGNTAGGGIGYVKNNGNGTFTDFPNANSAGTPFTTFDFTGQQITPASMFVVDYDNDGDVDIIDRDALASLGIWKNNNGVFTQGTNTIAPTMAFPSRMIFGDFDNDGDLDVLYQSSNTAGAGMGYLQNNGSGMFTDFTNANSAGTPFATFDFTGQQITPASVFVFDYDNDGDVDIIDRDALSSLGIWRNNNGAFTQGTNTIAPTMAFPSRMTYADYDSDGDIDILYQSGNTAGAGFGYLQNTGNGTYNNFTDATVAGTPFSGFSFAGLQIAADSWLNFDYDKDGDLDIMYRAATSGLWVKGGRPPYLTASSPAHNTVAVGTASNIVLTFNEPVVSGGGNLYIRRSSDNSIWATIPTNGALVTGQNSAVITINPASNLPVNTSFYLTFDATAFKDAENHMFGELRPANLSVRPITRNDFLSFTTGTALPVSLLNFDAAISGAAVQLSWTTAREMNTAFFEVQYSRDGKLFQPAGKVPAMGKNGIGHTYAFTHKPGTGKFFYRLNMVDADGSSSLSEVKMLTLEAVSGIRVYPNPVKNKLNIVADANNSLEQVVLYDLQGRTIKRAELAGQAQLDWDLSHLAAGTYLLKFTGIQAEKSILIIKE